MYFFSRADLPFKGKLIVEGTSKFGKRVLPPQWARGGELWINLRYSFLNWFTLGGGGGYNWDTKKGGASLEGGFNIYRDDNLNTGVVLYTTRETERVWTIGSTFLFSTGLFKFLDITINNTFEKAFANDRDPVDWFLSAGVSSKATKFLRIGLEYIGEDLEDIWEREETEGGAANLIGALINFKVNRYSGISLEPSVNLGPRSKTGELLFFTRVWLEL